MSLQYSLFFIQRFKGKVLFNQSMSDYTSFRIGGPADTLSRIIIALSDSPFVPEAAPPNFESTNLKSPCGGITGYYHGGVSGSRASNWAIRFVSYSPAYSPSRNISYASL